jgi:hypothetical protein
MQPPIWRSDPDRMVGVNHLLRLFTRDLVPPPDNATHAYLSAIVQLIGSSEHAVSSSTARDQADCSDVENARRPVRMLRRHRGLALREAGEGSKLRVRSCPHPRSASAAANSCRFQNTLGPARSHRTGQARVRGETRRRPGFRDIRMRSRHGPVLSPGREPLTPQVTAFRCGRGRTSIPTFEGAAQWQVKTTTNDDAIERKCSSSRSKIVRILAKSCETKWNTAAGAESNNAACGILFGDRPWGQRNAVCIAIRDFRRIPVHPAYA